MIDVQLISIIIGIFTGLGVLLSGLGFAYAQFRQGEGKAKDDLISTLKEAAMAEKEKAARLVIEKSTIIDSHQQQINELNSKIGKLQGLYEASESSKKEYLSILQGKDPSQKSFMELMTKSAFESSVVIKEAQAYMTDTIAILGEIRLFMENLNKSAQQTSDFTHKVEVATKEEIGKVLRKED